MTQFVFLAPQFLFSSNQIDWYSSAVTLALFVQGACLANWVGSMLRVILEVILLN
jgi:hypothetical protein